MSEAPWTDQEVANINEFQRGGAFHPFTCACPHPQRNDRLVAHNDGLRCDHCGFTQTWVHSFMSDGSAMKSHRELMEQINDR
jgi:hypothetical protein